MDKSENIQDEQSLSPKAEPDLIIPVGTQVLTLVKARHLGGKSSFLSGSVGAVIKAPTDNRHSYIVQFPNGTQSSLHRKEIAIRKHFQDLNLDREGTALDDRELHRHIIYRCIVGSRAFGLDVDQSDVDRRGIFLTPAAMQWSLYGLPEQIENDASQECYWELQKFLVLALKANPNVLECLYTPLVEESQPIALELLAQRHRFLSRLVYQTYNGYVLSQFRKLEQDLRARGELKWKHAMHLIRLLLSGITILQENHVPVLVDKHRAELIAIRSGELSWDEINAWRLDLHKTFDLAYAQTSLPERPDYQWVNQFLIKARRQMVSE